MLYRNDLKYFLKGCLELLVYFPRGSAGKESAYSVGDLGSLSGLGRSPGEGIRYPLQYSGLENIEESLYSWKKSQSIMMHDHFSMVSDSIC